MQFFFSNHSLDTDRRELARGGEGVAVEPQVFDLLVFLVQNRNRVVSKDDLIANIWDGRIVSESTLTSRLNAARKAVGDSGKEQTLIRTLPRRGVRFVGDVSTDHGMPQTGESPLMISRAEISVSSSRRGPRALAPQANDRPAIAVLPFTNMSGQPEQEYFSEGISEDIITALSKLRWFHVTARNSSFSYKGKPVHLKQIGDELGVGYVVEGSVRREGERVRITAQLIDVVTGSHLWAERYDRNIADVFAVQDEITQAIVAAIEPQLYAAEGFRACRKAPDNVDAWDLVMRALSHYWRVTRQDNVAAQALLEKAISIDPNYGQALGVLAASHTLGGHMGWEEMAAAVPVAERAACAAIHADGEDPWAHYALGGVRLFNRRFDDSIAAYELALRLNPNFALARSYYGRALTFCGLWEDGDREARHALRLSPRDPFAARYCGVAAFARFVGRDYGEAIRLSRDALRQRRDLAGAHRVLTAAAGMSGLTDVAATALQALRRAQPDITLAWIATQMPIKRDVDREHYLEGFGRAGLE
jgi:TolB-like protein/cytochrome c-type biogenesis protein CcmH/NrfG